MRFSKYEGTGNDFVLIADPGDRLTLDEELARALCDRRRGVGADGVIRATRAEGADLFMDYRNADGSLAEICGNGLRCLALFALAEGLVEGETLTIATRAGTRTARVVSTDVVEVDMGPPVFEPEAIPVLLTGAHPLAVPVDVGGETLSAACLSMGNPHAVVFVDDPAAVALEHLGPRIERHRVFPRGANVSFAAPVGAERVVARVWERGSGATLACGTAACAVGVAARLLHGMPERLVVELPGGELEVRWNGDRARPSPVTLTGPARRVFSGELDPASLLRR